MSDSVEREKFEAFNESEDGNGYDLICYAETVPVLGGEYIDERAEAMWRGWQAALSSRAPAEPTTPEQNDQRRREIESALADEWAETDGSQWTYHRWLHVKLVAALLAASRAPQPAEPSPGEARLRKPLLSQAQIDRIARRSSDFGDTQQAVRKAVMLAIAEAESALRGEVGTEEKRAGR